MPTKVVESFAVFSAMHGMRGAEPYSSVHYDEGGGGGCGNLALLRVPCAAAISRAIGHVGSFKIYFNRSIIGLKGL